jgi:hypothetical protein
MTRSRGIGCGTIENLSELIGKARPLFKTCMSDDPKLNEWKLLRDQFDARVREGSDIEVIFDAEFRRRFTELINRVIEPQH